VSIDLQKMLRQKARSFGQSVESTRFIGDFLAAVDAVSADLRLRTSLDPDQAASTAVNIDLDEGKYGNVYTHGVDYFLLVFGIQSERDLKTSNVAYMTALADCQAQAITDGDYTGKLGDLSE